MSDYENSGQPRIKGYNPYTGEPIYEEAIPASSAPTAPMSPAYSTPDSAATTQVQQPVTTTYTQQPAAQTQPFSSPEQTQPFGAHAASAYSNPNPQPAPVQPAYTSSTQSAASSAKPAKKQKGGAKSFFLSFLGAALACVIALVAYTAVTSTSSGSSSTSSLGSSSSTSITVNGEDTTLAEAVAAKTTSSVCCIYVYTQSSSSGYYNLFGGGSNSNSNSSTLEESSLGSGVILSADGYVLTNYHVIEGAAALKVSAGGTEYDATIVGTDESSDLAVIKLTGASGLTPIEIGDSDSLTTGQWVMTIGSPFGLESSVATGIVSATSRSQIYQSSDDSSYYGTGSTTTTVYVNMIQTDAAINPGNSGGALVDSDGKLIGINTLITSYSGNYSGVGFAIPVNYAMSIAQQLMNGQTPSHAQMGVSLVSVTSTLAQRYNLPVSEGAYISAVSANTGAADAGLQVGDIITKVDGKSITSASDLMIAVREHSVGDKITVTYNRNGTESTADVTLGSDNNSSSSILQQNSADGYSSSTGA